MKAKIYLINETEYWVGYDLETVKAHYSKITGEQTNDIEELLDKELYSNKVRVDFTDEGLLPGIYTFKKYLTHLIRTNTELPCFFAGYD